MLRPQKSPVSADLLGLGLLLDVDALLGVPRHLDGLDDWDALTATPFESFGRWLGEGPSFAPVGLAGILCPLREWSQAGTGFLDAVARAYDGKFIRRRKSYLAFLCFCRPRLRRFRRRCLR